MKPLLTRFIWQAEVKKLAFYLFYNIKGDTARNHILEEDLHPFLSPDLAREAFQMLDQDGNEKVNLHVSASLNKNSNCMSSFLKALKRD